MSAVERNGLIAFLRAVKLARKACARHLDVTAIMAAIVLHDAAPPGVRRDRCRKALVALYS